MTILRCLYVNFRLFLDCVIDFLFSLYWDTKKSNVPYLEKKHHLLAESAVALAAKIKRKELKSEDLVRAVIERIKQVNPVVNAITYELFESALVQARDVDRMIASGLSSEDALKKPFLGVPFTSKESQAVAGCPLTLGLLSRRSVKATEDSEVIKQLKDAGAIPIALTNLPELLVWQETRNLLYGKTNNPHHTGRSPGGSSGAEAALTATYATPISLCSDLGGSTRMPAFYCGQFGHHPTAGVTNVKGCFLRNGDEDSMLSMGFITKHTEDLVPLFKVITPNHVDKLNLDRDIEIKNLKFLYVESSNDVLLSPVRTELKDAMKRVVAKLTAEGMEPKNYYHDSLNHMYSMWSYMMSFEPDNLELLYHNFERKANGLFELVKKVIGLSQHCIFTIVRLLELQILNKLIPLDANKKRLEDLKKDLISKLGNNGILLFPSAPQSSPYHYSCLLRPYNFSYWALVNALKFPATQVPLGVDSNGLPIGIQVVATPYNDALCIAVAKYLENAFGGAVMACGKLS